MSQLSASRDLDPTGRHCSRLSGTLGVPTALRLGPGWERGGRPPLEPCAPPVSGHWLFSGVWGAVGALVCEWGAGDPETSQQAS